METDNRPAQWPGEVPPTFCGECGYTLMRETYTLELSGYNRHSGQPNPPMTFATLRCPLLGKAPRHDWWRL